MSNHKIRASLWSPLAPFGLAVAVAVCLIDQTVKFWLHDIYDLGARGAVRILPFLDLVLTWNKGISYGLFQQDGALGRWVLLALSAIAVALLWVWLNRSGSRLTVLALGLIIGGAVGNAIDRLHWPGVMDFVLFHIHTREISFNWYVFNLADAAIVAGVVGLLYESLLLGRAAKAP
jgi:signal peptidase II